MTSFETLKFDNHHNNPIPTIDQFSPVEISYVQRHEIQPHQKHVALRLNNLLDSAGVDLPERLSLVIEIQDLENGRQSVTAAVREVADVRR